MQEINSHLFIGSDADYEDDVSLQPGGWRVVQAAKYPYHRDAVGYGGRAAPEGSPEYYVARRDNRLILNLIDAPSPNYVPQQVIDTALRFIHAGLDAGEKVLVHCNQGQSRAPTIGLLYLAVYTNVLPTKTFSVARLAFEILYPAYYPGAGMRGYATGQWARYMQGRR
ncbi:MAG: dual specificity protein phosphatase family protein [Armatimonadota bacterium]